MVNVSSFRSSGADVPEFNELVVTSVKFVLCFITGVAKIYHIILILTNYLRKICTNVKHLLYVKRQRMFFFKFIDNCLNDCIRYYYRLILTMNLAKVF